MKIYAESGEARFEVLPEDAQKSVAELLRKVSESTDKADFPSWSGLDFKKGEIVAALDEETQRIIMFPSTGNEAWDTEIAQRNGIQTPTFSCAEGVLRSYYNDGVMVFKDDAEGVEPPVGATESLQIGVDY